MRRRIASISLVFLMAIFESANVIAEDPVENAIIGETEIGTEDSELENYGITEFEKGDYMSFSIDEDEVETKISLIGSFSTNDQASLAFADLVNIAVSDYLEDYNMTVCVSGPDGNVYYMEEKIWIHDESDESFINTLPDWFITNEEDITMSDEEISLYSSRRKEFCGEFLDYMLFWDIRKLAIDDSKDSDIVSIMTEEHIKDIVDNLDFMVNMDYETDSNKENFVKFVYSAGYLYKFADGTKEKELSNKAFELVKSVIINKGNREEIGDEIEKLLDE